MFDKEFIFSLKEISVAGSIILSSLIAIGTMVYKTYKQLTPNSGSSLRDRIDSISFQLNKMELGQKVYLDNIEDTPMFFTNKNGDCEWVNKAYLNLVKKPLSEILGTNWACCIIQDDREKVENEWKNTADAHRNFDMTYRFIDDNGNITRVHGRAWGNSSGYVGIVRKMEN